MKILPRILICDDEPLMTDSIKKILGEEDYQIQTTNNASRALTYIHAEDPDLVILDVLMPEMTGFEVLDAIDQTRCDAAFIIITGDASFESAIAAIRRGASDYLRKPFEPEELIIRVENALKQRQIKHEHMCIKAEKRQLEKQLRQSQKMEAIGTLAGGIAHDFNNILSIILGNTELALADMPMESPPRQNLEQILAASLRAREMIQQLLNFSRKDESGLKPLHLNCVIAESLKLMRASLPTNIAIEKDICKKECTTMADTTQIHQIMLNLCTNAAHAMETEGGVLTVRLESVVLDETAVEGFGIPPGNYARLVVADTGRGIEKDVIDRIFDPYFTTKKDGRGTGMGLSVVHGIVKGNGGTIQAFSRPGRFTEFHIYLPLVDAVIETETATEIPQHLPGGDEHILIVDDEEMLVDMMRQVLEQLGYKVSAYTDSTAAFKAFLSCPLAYHLMITDMTMPGMTGTGLSKAVKAVRNDIPIILCTGFNEQIRDCNIQALGIQDLIMKPVGMRELAETIRRVLTMKTPAERRRHPRMEAPINFFVISRETPYERCNLLDISLSGLAFSHEIEEVDAPLKDQLAIMAPDGTIFVSDIHCRTISDISSEGESDISNRRSIRRGVMFENMNDHQIEQINQLINAYGVESARAN